MGIDQFFIFISIDCEQIVNYSNFFFCLTIINYWKKLRNILKLNLPFFFFSSMWSVKSDLTRIYAFEKFIKNSKEIKECIQLYYGNWIF